MNKATKIRETPMPQDSTHFLNELPIWKLKIVAAEYKIDVSSCKYKKEFVVKIKSKKLTDQQVRKALAKSKPPAIEEPQNEKVENEPLTSDMDRIAADVEIIATQPKEPAEIPAEEDRAVDRHIDEALGTRPSFFEVDSTAEGAMGKMLMGDFHEAIKLNREARTSCYDTFSSYQVFSTALSIRAVDEMLGRLPEGPLKSDSNLKTAIAAAKGAFLSGTPRQREEALESLEELASKTYEAYVKDTEGDEEQLKSLLADYESFGTRTEEARRYLEIAGSARQTFNIDEYSRFIKEARDRAEESKKDRVKEIEGLFHMVNAAVNEAKELGADPAQYEESVGNARKAFDDGSFKRAVDLLASVEKAVDSHHLDQIRKRKDLESMQLQKATKWIALYEPVLSEAASYGLDVKHGLNMLVLAKMAVDRRDPIGAAKYGRSMVEHIMRIERELDNKRLELGVIRHVEGGVCEKCGQEALYEYPNGMQKCLECGHAKSIKPSLDQGVPKEPPSAAMDAKPDEQVRPPAEKKRRLFRW